MLGMEMEMWGLVMVEVLEDVLGPVLVGRLLRHYPGVTQQIEKTHDKL